MASSIMPQLFERGNFPHILEDIFLLLDPRSLHACSLVCKTWREFLLARVWRTPAGARRIAHNWLCGQPVERRIVLNESPLPSPCPYAHAPSAVVASQDAVVVAAVGNIDLYDRWSCRFRRRLHDGSGDRDAKWVLCMTARYLVAKRMKMLNSPGEPFEVFRVRKDFQRVPMKDKQPTDMVRVSCLRMASEDALAVESYKNRTPSVLCYRISEETLRYHLLWCVTADFSCVDIGVGRRRMVLASHASPSTIRLTLHDASDGKRLGEMEFNPGEHTSVTNVTSAGSRTGIVLAHSSVAPWKETAAKIFICDLERGFLVRELAVDCWTKVMASSNNLWCDGSVGTITLAARSNIWVWDIRDLLLGNAEKSFNRLTSSDKEFDEGLLCEEEEDRMNNDALAHRVIRTTDCGGVGARAHLRHGFIYASVGADGKWFLVDLNFWGRL